MLWIQIFTLVQLKTQLFFLDPNQMSLTQKCLLRLILKYQYGLFWP